jgi:CheY-like chemotaxis protein
MAVAARVTRMTSANRAILVVEDELLLRLMAVEIVEDAGFEALAAATADEALSILEARADDGGGCSDRKRDCLAEGGGRDVGLHQDRSRRGMGIQVPPGCD